jgi:hypothetical protein
MGAGKGDFSVNEEKAKILSLFKEGKLSAEEALEALEKKRSEKRSFPFDKYPVMDIFEQAFRRTMGVTSGVLGTVLEEVKDMVDSVGKGFIAGESNLVVARSVTEEIDPGEALLLKLEGRDDTFRVTTHKDTDNEIVVQAEILVPRASLGSSKEVEIVSEKDESQVRIFSRFKSEQQGARLRWKVRYEVKVPPGMRVFVSTKNGEIEVADICSAVDAENRNGNILVSNIKGDVNVRSSNGNIRALNISGRANLEVKNGAIKTRGVRGAITARTLAGAIRLDGVSGPVEAETKTGSISARVLSLSENDAYSFKSSMGSIKIFANEDSNFRVEAVTKMGKIVSDFRTSEFKHDSGSGTIVHVGKGSGARMIAETGFGSVKILKDTSVESDF